MPADDDGVIRRMPASSERRSTRSRGRGAASSSAAGALAVRRDASWIDFPGPPGTFRQLELRATSRTGTFDAGGRARQGRRGRRHGGRARRTSTRRHDGRGRCRARRSQAAAIAHGARRLPAATTAPRLDRRAGDPRARRSSPPLVALRFGALFAALLAGLVAVAAVPGRRAARVQRRARSSPIVPPLARRGRRRWWSRRWSPRRRRAPARTAAGAARARRGANRRTRRLRDAAAARAPRCCVVAVGARAAGRRRRCSGSSSRRSTSASTSAASRAAAGRRAWSAIDDKTFDAAAEAAAGRSTATDHARGHPQPDEGGREGDRLRRPVHRAERRAEADDRRSIDAVEAARRQRRAGHDRGRAPDGDDRDLRRRRGARVQPRPCPANSGYPHDPDGRIRRMLFRSQNGLDVVRRSPRPS